MFSLTPFIVSSYFPTLSITLLLEILGRRMHGPSRTSNFAKGTLPQPPQISAHARDYILKQGHWGRKYRKKIVLIFKLSQPQYE